MQETRVRPLSGEDPLEEEMATTPVFLPGESHGQRNLVGYCPWGPIELAMTEWLMHTHTHMNLNILFSISVKNSIVCVCDCILYCSCQPKNLAYIYMQESSMSKYSGCFKPLLIYFSI